MADDVIKTLIAEAYAEGPEGMRRVAETILNRAAIRGITPQQVVRERHQYTGLQNPGPAARRAWSDPKAISAAQAALEVAMQPGDPTGGADHYYAPGSVSQPYWAKSMASKGEYGGHKFFASRPIPPGALNYAVGTLTDTVPPRIPAPVTPSPDMAALRARAYVPSNLVADSFARVQPRAAPQRRAADLAAMDRQQVAPILQRNGKLVDPAEVILYGKNPEYLNIGSLPTSLAEPRIAQTRTAADMARIYASGGPTRPPTDQMGIANTGRPMLDNGDGSFSTELAITVTDTRINDGKPTNIPTIWGGRRLSEEQAINTARASGQKFQSFPSIPAAVAAAEYHSANDIGPATRSAPAMPTRASQSYAGQDRALVASRPTPIPTQQSSQLLGRRTAASVPAAQEAANRAAAASRPAARLPDLPPSRLGQSPTTRTVQAIPVSRQTASDRVRGNAQQTRNVATTVASIPTTSMPPIPRSRPNTSGVVASLPTAPVRQRVSASDMVRGRSGAVVPDRLSAGVAGMPANYGTIRPDQVAAIGVDLGGAPTPVGVRPVTQVAQVAPIAAPTPLPSSMRPTGVGTQLSTTPPRTAPIPRARPDFGIGGPDFMQQIGDHLMNNTLPGRAIGGAGFGFGNLAAGRPLLGTTAQQGASLQAIGNTLMDHTMPGRLFGMVTGQRQNPVQSLISFLQPQRANPVGTDLGRAANGGRMIQGVNGIQNSLTQNSDYWREATGTQPRYTDNGDGSRTSQSGGTYYDRHL